MLVYLSGMPRPIAQGEAECHLGCQEQEARGRARQCAGDLRSSAHIGGGHVASDAAPGGRFASEDERSRGS